MMMKRLVSILLLAGCATTRPQTTGTYAGDLVLPWGAEIVNVEITGSDSAALVQQDVSDFGGGGAQRTPLEHFSLRGNAVTFTRSRDGRSVTCRATLRDGLMTGDGDCRVRAARVEPFPRTDAILGAYRTEDGHLIDVSRSNDAGFVTLLTDYDRNLWRAIYHRGGGRFTFGSGMVDPAPAAGSITFHDDGTASLAYGNGRAVRATRVHFREKPVAWENGEAKLRGTLILPDGDGPFPAVVMTQSSGGSDRNGYRPVAQWFASRGVAALVYDRRGIGESTGESRNVGFPDLAQDAANAALALQQIAEVDRNNIGVWGQSQGGWIAPLAAAKTKAIAWVIAQSGPAVTASEQEVYRIAQQARIERYSPEETAEVVAYEAALDRYRTTGEGREELIAIARRSKDKRWTALVPLVDDTLPPRPSEVRRTQFWSYDPVPEYRKVTVPILAIYGDRDSYVPAEKSAAIWRRIFEENGNRDGAVLMMKGAAHGQWLGEADGFPDLVRSPGYHPDYWPALDAFLRRYVTSGAARARRTTD